MFNYLCLLLLGTLGSLASAQIPRDRHHLCNVSVCFAFDESGSVRDPMFANSKLAALAIGYSFGLPSTYSIVKYSGDPTNVLNPTTNLVSFDNAVDSLSNGEGQTDTEDGLSSCSRHLMNAAFPKVIVLLTDGGDATNDLVTARAAEVKGLGMKLVIVNVGPSSRLPALQVLASHPSLAVNFASVSGLIVRNGPLQDHVCKACCPAMKVCYAIDESWSMLPVSAFATVMNGLVATTSVHSIFAPTSVYWAVQFTNVASLLSGPTNGPFMMDDLGSNTMLGGLTDIARGLRICNARMGTGGLPKLIVLVSDGHNGAGDDPEALANSLKSSGVRIVTVGIGSSPNGVVLGNIASPNSYVPVTRFDSIYEAIGPLTNAMCHARRGRPVPTIPFLFVGCKTMVCVRCSSGWKCYVRSGSKPFDELACGSKSPIIRQLRRCRGGRVSAARLSCTQGRTFGIWGTRGDRPSCDGRTSPSHFVQMKVCVNDDKRVRYECDRNSCSATSSRCWPTVV